MNEETAFVAVKQRGARERQTAVCSTADDAHEWLAQQIDADPYMGEYVVKDYKKTVYEAVHESGNHGHIEEMPLLEGFEDPLIDAKQPSGVVTPTD